MLSGDHQCWAAFPLQQDTFAWLRDPNGCLAHSSSLTCIHCLSRVIFYSPQLFITLGTGTQGALVATIVTGVVNHFATYVSLWAADAYGRRILWMEAGVQVCASPEHTPFDPSSFYCPTVVPALAPQEAVQWGCRQHRLHTPLLSRSLRPCFVG